tara:strand:+ start:350 stop:571 length:222 start_codon:yes stop_codon:yes gene_type:complete
MSGTVKGVVWDFDNILIIIRGVGEELGLELAVVVVVVVGDELRAAADELLRFVFIEVAGKEAEAEETEELRVK